MKTGKDDMPQQSEIYYNHLESQFDSTDGTNAILIMKLLKLDDEHGDQNIIEAVRYLVDKDCRPEGDAPTNFLTDNEVSAINRDGKFRPKLYSMLLVLKSLMAYQTRHCSFRILMGMPGKMTVINSQQNAYRNGSLRFELRQ